MTHQRTRRRSSGIPNAGFRFRHQRQFLPSSERVSSGTRTKKRGTPLVSVPQARASQKAVGRSQFFFKLEVVPLSTPQSGVATPPSPPASQAFQARAMQVVMKSSMVASAVAMREMMTKSVEVPRMMAASSPVVRPKRMAVMR